MQNASCQISDKDVEPEVHGVLSSQGTKCPFISVQSTNPQNRTKRGNLTKINIAIQKMIRKINYEKYFTFTKTFKQTQFSFDIRHSPLRFFQLKKVSIASDQHFLHCVKSLFMKYKYQAKGSNVAHGLKCMSIERLKYSSLRCAFIHQVEVKCENELDKRTLSNEKKQAI